MDRSWISSILLLLLILFVSNASSRGLVDEQLPNDTSNSTNTQSPPLPNVTPVGGDVKPNVTSSLPATNSTTSPDSKEPDSASPPPPPPPQPPQLQDEGEKNVTVVSNATEVAISPPPANQTESKYNGKLPAPPPKSLESGNNATVEDKGNPPPSAKDPEKVDDTKGSSESAVAETCAGKAKICRTENSLVACTLSIEKDSSKWLILVQNEGEEPLIAKIVLPVSSSPYLTLTKHQSQRVNISISGDTSKIILDAGQGECVLHMYSPQQNTLSIHLPSYEKLLTPINGACFLIVSVIIFGGAWGLCLCRKNRRVDNNGVPYRELEMSGGGTGLESVHDVETADWDEGWDDDWDENNAVKSPGGAANSARISANGLTARGPSKDGWEDWDD